MKKGLAFRTAYKISGSIVAKCIAENRVLEELTLSEYRVFCELIDEDVYAEIALETCVNKRISEGGTGKASQEKQIALMKEFLAK